MTDFAKIDKVLDWIEAHPERHDQGQWCMDGDGPKPRSWCGTTLCLAGATVMLERAGWKPVFYRDSEGTWFADEVKDRDGNYEKIETLAERFLDLSERDANALFFATNSLRDLRRYVAEMREDEEALTA